ncbi:hypothetical protein CKO28_19755 [Rhodovibrio sodomensis]|uniref:Anti-sigma factor n=1 Tax=Rhodovibrio sodomensis TaxID=1088 RepID=A0ABS1DLK2_9PROT|nr:hypothetical protein [Rhodovibrio sodomensis]MBK1670265.1 hypothetical protein [Rhodovibrio sodomensis]
MTAISDEDLTAYADNELPESRHREVAEALQHDHALRQRYQRIAQAGTLARQAYAELADEPAPAHLRRIAETAATAEPGTEPGLRHAYRRSVGARIVAANWVRWLWRPVPALGAGVVAGALAGALAVVLFTPEDSGRTPGLDLTGQIPRDSPIHEALQTVASGEVSQAGETRVAPVATFRPGGATVCREYQARLPDREDTLAGVACRREDGRWSNEAVLWLSKDGTYRTAEGASALRRLRDSWRTAEPLSPAAEKRVLSNSET